MAIAVCGAERAEDVHRLTQEAFRDYTWLEPPSGALRETLERVREDLAAGGGAIAELQGEPVGCLRWQPASDGSFHVRRVAVAMHARRRGVGRALMTWAEVEARRRGCDAVTVGVRITLPGNLAFYRGLGYEIVGEHSHDGYADVTWLGLRKPVGT
jgi:ribosomal protein S18 acetylase RimI-like enzyme